MGISEPLPRAAETNGFDYLPLGICVLDRDLMVCSWNRTLEQWTGLCRNDILGRRLTDFFPHLAQPRIQIRLDDVFVRRTPVLLSAALHKYFIPVSIITDGKSFGMVQKTTLRSWDETGRWALAAIEDVTASHQQLDQLRAEKRQLQIAFQEVRSQAELIMIGNERLTLTADAANVGFWDWDITSNVLTWNDAMFRILDVQPDQFGSVYEAWRATLHPDDAERAETEVHLALEGTREFHTTFRIVRSDGTVRYIRGDAKVLRTAVGQPIRMLGINLDVTAQVEREQELECRVTERTRDLQAAYDRLQTETAERTRAEDLLRHQQSQLTHIGRLSTMGEMAAGIAHELNQPLYAVHNFVTGLMRMHQNGRLKPETIESILPQVTREIERAGDIIRRIRTFVRRGELTTTTLDLATVIQDSVRLIDFDARRREVAIHVHPANETCWVAGDLVQLQQVLVNLLQNAFDAMDSVPAAERFVDISWFEQNGSVEIRVQDNGQGIEESQLNSIFEAFVTTKSKGLGMGLAISRSIVELHQGQLRAAPGEPRGAVFLLVLPLVEAPTQTMPELTASQ